MNIDKEKFERKLCTCCSIKAVKKLLFDCEAEPVDCNECINFQFATEQTSICCQCRESYTVKFKQKPKEWYEDESNFPCLCWCNGIIRLVKSSYVFNGDRCFTSDTIIAFDNATPLTKEEVLKYCVGEE